MASWHAAFTGLVPRDFLNSIDARGIAAGRSRLLVAHADGEVVGYAGIGAERDESAPTGTGELYALFVDPSSWGRGAGRALTDAALADLHDGGAVRVWLWVLEANERARRFYERYGFTATTDRTTSSVGNLPELRYTYDLSGRAAAP